MRERDFFNLIQHAKCSALEAKRISESIREARDRKMRCTALLWFARHE